MGGGRETIACNALTEYLEGREIENLRIRIGGTK
jgi:hypothetical protein